MADETFVKKVWKKGDIITAADLNRLEDAVDSLMNPAEPAESAGGAE